MRILPPCMNHILQLGFCGKGFKLYSKLEQMRIDSVLMYKMYMNGLETQQKCVHIFLTQAAKECSTVIYTVIKVKETFAIGQQLRKRPLFTCTINPRAGRYLSGRPIFEVQQGFAIVLDGLGQTFSITSAISHLVPYAKYS